MLLWSSRTHVTAEEGHVRLLFEKDAKRLKNLEEMSTQLFHGVHM